MTQSDQSARRFSGLPWLWGSLAIAMGLLFPATARLEPFTLLLLALIFGALQMVLAPLLAHRLARRAQAGPPTE